MNSRREADLWQVILAANLDLRSLGTEALHLEIKDSADRGLLDFSRLSHNQNTA
jgi:hypothetical protein